MLTIEVNQDGVSQLMVNGEPAIKTQKLETEVIVKNKHTVLLGGIIHQVNSSSQTGIPVLDRIPLLGDLFKSTHSVSQRKVLLLLVTPEIAS